MTKIEQIKNLIKHVPGNRIITVSFTKKDGTERVMQCHRAKALEAKVAEIPNAATIKRRATLDATHKLCVEELVRVKGHKPVHQWRTINLETVKTIHTNRKVYEF